MTRRGVICGGCWLVDHNKTIQNWPAEETLTTVLAQETDGGGPAHNMAMDLARLDPSLPLWAMGALGHDREAELILGWCRERGIDAGRLRRLDDVGTSYTDVMTVAQTGKRTFFHYQGANAALTPDDFDFRDIPARILHLGAPGIHARMDAPWGDDASGWVTVLKKARAAGLHTNLEMISAAPEELRSLTWPCLEHLDSLIVNDFEAGALTGLELLTPAGTSAEAARRAAERLLDMASLELVVIHFPMGCVAASRTGERIARPSVNVPAAEIRGTNGAGDAFAAGVLYGLHEAWPLERSLELGLAAAASALRSVSTTHAVATRDECLALAQTWGWRPAIS
jgi:sugar/nucleoside kinase (ribokinase family)